MHRLDKVGEVVPAEAQATDDVGVGLGNFISGHYGRSSLSVS
jgi:hypothetical protein